MNILDKIRNAKPGSYVDIRTPDNQIDSFRVEDVQAIFNAPPLTGDRPRLEPCGCSQRGMCAEHFKQRQVDDRFPSYMKGVPKK